MKARGALAGAVLVVATMVAACGGSGTSDAAVSIETLQAAASNSQAAESSRFTMDVTVDVEGEPTTVSVDGVMAGDGKTGELTVATRDALGELGTVPADGRRRDPGGTRAPVELLGRARERVEAHVDHAVDDALVDGSDDRQRDV